MDERKLEWKVGLFVVVLLAAGFGVVFLLGTQRHVFKPRVRLHATFREVSGLRVGAPVWLSGVSAGQVTRIAFTRGPAGARVRVDLQLLRSDLSLVRADSVARIGSQGLLGDKIVEIAVGSPSARELEPDAELLTEEPADIDKLLAQASDIMRSGQSVAHDAATAMRSIADPKFIANVHGTVGSLRRIVRAIEKGPGLAHALFYDRETERGFARLSADLQRLTAHVDRGVLEIDRILESTDDDGRQVINHVARAAQHVGGLAADVRATRIVPHIDRAAADLAEITGSVRAGYGTLGALVTDPTVYDQLVTVLGGVARSRVLRALVRFAIKRSDPGRDAARMLHTPPDLPPSLAPSSPQNRAAAPAPR